MAKEIIFLCLAITLIAFLYSSVGHAGASGYIAVMTLFSLPASIIKPPPLTMNILIAILATFQFWKAGYFSWKIFWPFAVTSIPFAFIGGYINLPDKIFKILIGAVLLYSSARFILNSKDVEFTSPPSKGIAMSTGAGLGFLSGLSGVGGGIFLTPLIIFMRWAKTRTASAVSALFILVNSISGLSGNVINTKTLPSFILPLIISAIIGGAAGSYLGSRKFSTEVIRKILAVVLAIAGIKMIFA